MAWSDWVMELGTAVGRDERAGRRSEGVDVWSELARQWSAKQKKKTRGIGNPSSLSS
jgi:hypothetical protein